MAAAPETSLGTIEFTPEQAGADVGHTTWTPESDGLLWMTVVQDFVTGTDLHVLVDGDWRPGPHDGDRRQLEAALRQIPHQFPHLEILGLADEPVEPEVPDPAVEAAKELVRERFTAAFEALPPAARAALEAPLEAILDPISRATHGADLWASFQRALDVIKQGDEALEAFVEPVMQTLRRDAEEPSLPEALRWFCAAFLRWQIVMPTITHSS